MTHRHRRGRAVHRPGVSLGGEDAIRKVSRRSAAEQGARCDVDNDVDGSGEMAGRSKVVESGVQGSAVKKDEDLGGAA